MTGLLPTPEVNEAVMIANLKTRTQWQQGRLVMLWLMQQNHRSKSIQTQITQLREQRPYEFNIKLEEAIEFFRDKKQLK